jgi:hypothetical protein
MLCIEDQNGDHVVYHQGTYVPFGSLFSKYMSNKGIQLIGVSHGRRIGYNEMPKGLGFDTEHHVIIFVNLLMFFDQGELEYQVKYPLTGGNERKGVLNEDTMKDLIDALIERGHVVKIVPEGDEAAPRPHERYCVQQDQEQDFYHWSLYTAHHNRGMDFGDHSEMEVLFEIKTIRQSGKAAKNWLMKNCKWGGQLMFMNWLNYGLIHVIEILLSNVLVYRHGGELSPLIGAGIVAEIMGFVANGMMMTPNAPGNVIGRGCIAALNESFLVNLPTAVQKTKMCWSFV